MISERDGGVCASGIGDTPKPSAGESCKAEGKVTGVFRGDGVGGLPPVRRRFDGGGRKVDGAAES